MGFLDDVRKNIENAVEDVKDNVSEALHLPGAEQGQANVQDQSAEASTEQPAEASVPADDLSAVVPVAEEATQQDVAPVAEAGVPAAVPEAAVAAPVEVSVQEGDSLSAIAAANGVDLDSLIAANPEIENPDLIYPGQVLRLP